MENMLQPENENFSSENEETEAMKEEQTAQPEVQLDASGNIQDSPEEIGAIEIPESDIAGGIPESIDDTREVITSEFTEAAAAEMVTGTAPAIETADTTAVTNDIEGGISAPASSANAIADAADTREQQAALETSEAAVAEKVGDEIEEMAHESDNAAAELPAGDEDEHDEDEHLHEEEENFEGYTKEQLLEFVQNAAGQTDARNMNKKVQQARTEFNRLVKEERTEALENWKSEGNEEGAFVPEEDPMLRDFNQAFKSYKKSRLEYVANLNVQKEQNLAVKKDILEKLKGIAENSESASSFNDFRKLQEEWRKIGHVPITEAENIWNSYNYYVNKFYEQRSLISEFRELDSKRNMAAKEEVVARIESLLPMEDLTEALRLLKQYQEEWKHIGPVPKDQLETIITRYKNAVIQLYEKKEKLSEELHQRREQNYEAKMALIEKIEEIAAFESTRVQDWINKNQELGQWIENWRSIGSIPIARGNDLKERFSAAIRQFNKNKNEFFRSRKREKVDNLRKKTELCEQAEAILASEEPPATRKKDVIKLQDEWKKSGPVPLKYSDKLWKRFQTACDAFFAKLVAQQSDHDREQYENLRLKNELIARVDALLNEETIEAPEQQIKALQDEFNHIGFVPFKEKDKIRKKFYASLNALITKVGGNPNAGGGRGDMLGYKLAVQSWGQEGGNQARLDSEEKKHVRELKRIENEISTLENNIEFFRNSKNAGELRANMDKQIAELKEKMKELQDKIKLIRDSGRQQR